MSVFAVKRTAYILLLVISLDILHPAPTRTTAAFSQNSNNRNRSKRINVNKNDNNNNNNDPQPGDGQQELVDLELEIDTNRRNLVVTAPLGVAGAVVYGKLVADSVEKLSRGDPNFVYPPEHEERVKDMISTAIITSLRQSKQNQEKRRPFRILEVGVGPQLRLIRRGLYNDALNQVADLGTLQQIDWTGIDIQSLPSLDSPVVQQAQSILNDNINGVKTDLRLFQSSISNSPSEANTALFEDGYFDCVISSLTLCSVDDPESSVREIHRMLRQDGGTFGYVEHVAVDDDEPYTVLKYQQIAFDPLQQLVADNCHLHRSTTQTVASVFGAAASVATTFNDSASSTTLSPQSKFIRNERFIVDKMWPVSCQTSGVVKKLIA